MLETIAWQKTKDATKKSHQYKPKPYIPEFMQKATSDVNKESTAKDIDEIKDILSRPRRTV